MLKKVDVTNVFSWWGKGGGYDLSPVISLTTDRGLQMFFLDYFGKSSVAN